MELNASEGDSERDESTEERLQCKRECLCTPHGTLSSAYPFIAIALCTESLHRIHATQEPTETEYATSEITKPQTYCGED